MANKLQKLFSDEAPSFSLCFSFDDKVSHDSFVQAIKRATEEGISVQSEGTTLLETSVRNGDNIYHTSDKMALRNILISPYKEDFPLNIPTKFGIRKLMLQKYYTTTETILETPDNAIVYLQTRFHPKNNPNSSLPAASLTYRVQPENASTIKELAEGYSTALSYITGLFGKTPKLTNHSDIAQYKQMQEFLSISVQLFQKLLFIEEKFQLSFQPSKVNNIASDINDIEEIYYLLKQKKALHLSAKINESNTNGNITVSSLNEIKIGQKLDITFRSTATYSILEQSLILHTASLLSNATVQQIENLSETQCKIIYGNDENNPMYISYTGFLTENEAIEEMHHIMEHKEMYTAAPELREVIKN